MNTISRPTPKRVAMPKRVANPSRVSGPLPVLSLVLALSLVVGVMSGPAAAQERPDLRDLLEAASEVERIDAMRSGLAAGFLEEGVPADREAFDRVCRPVGMEIRRVAEENDWIFEQLSEKYRNPAHAPDPLASGVLGRMEEDRGLESLALRTRRDGVEGLRYFRRIVVEPSCLACHGAKEDRPAFVREGFPEDRAYGFSPGDLRGVYSVFVPGSSGSEGSEAPEGSEASKTEDGREGQTCDRGRGKP